MFYSHEVLTSRKYGVATVWLVATLGSKSNLKKVSRKAILDVDVSKTCDTIIEPVAPMALRLSSNLLYGVTRVYAQQCGYVLTDAEATKTGMRAVFKALKADALDAVGGHKGRSDQLVLEDDPNFLPELDLLPMNLDDVGLVTGLDLLTASLTPESSQVNDASVQDFGGALMMPASASSHMGGPVGSAAAFSVRGDSGTGTRIGSGLFQQDEAHGFLEDDLGMQIDADGNFVMEEDIPAPPLRQPRPPSGRVNRTTAPSESPSVHNGREHELGQQDDGLLGLLDDDGYIPMQDDGYNAGEGEAFPARAEREEVRQQSVVSESAEAEQRRRPRAPPKTIPLDNTTELRGHDISSWNQHYTENMAEALRHKHAHRLVTLAKKNAEHWMMGPNYNELFQGNRDPLNMFTGIKLLESMTGLKPTPGGKKRAREEDPASEDSRRVRSRGEPSSDEIARGFIAEDNGFMPIADDYTIEQGRDQPTPLDDRHMSSIFPWNQSTVSQRPTGLFSAGRKSAIGANPIPPLSRRGSRLLTASPLVGRGLALGNEEDDLRLSESIGDVGPRATAEDEFELFGAAAQVDTQTAAESQWIRTALDGESANFLEFVKAGIDETDQEREAAPPGDEEDENMIGCIDFDQLLPPGNNTCVVAAQGLLHVLTLVTKNALKAEQQETFGPIGLRVMEV